jgi:hypothetical protein
MDQKLLLNVLARKEPCMTPKEPHYGAAVGDEDPNQSPMDPLEDSPGADASPERHFIVYFRDANWQFTYRGSITGPFADRDAAVQAAIQEAQHTGEKNVEVIVQEPDMRQETVWRPD